MIGTVEDLEKDIERFQKNIAASNELCDLLRQVLDEIKKEEQKVQDISQKAFTQISDLPRDIRGSIQDLNDENRRSLRRDCEEIISKLDSIMKRTDESVNDVNKHLSDAVGDVSTSVEKISEIKEDYSNTAEKFSERCNLLLNKIDEMNLSDLYKSNLRIEKSIKGKTILLCTLSLLAIVISIIGLIL